MYTENDEIIGFCAVIHFPHPKNPKIKKCHRIVILPDYQGIGLGTKFLECVAKIYVDMGFQFNITTSARNFIIKLNKSPNWYFFDFGMHKKSVTLDKAFQKSQRNKCKTASFRYNPV